MHLSAFIYLALMASVLTTGAAAQLDALKDSIEGLANADKLQQFCAANPGHVRCRPTRLTTAAELLAWCDSTEPGNRAYCAGTMMAMVHFQGRSLPEWSCVPKTVLESPEQLRLLFVREAHRRPEILHLSAENLLLYAVAKTFSCASPPRTDFR